MTPCYRATESPLIQPAAAVNWKPLWPRLRLVHLTPFAEGTRCLISLTFACFQLRFDYSKSESESERREREREKKKWMGRRKHLASVLTHFAYFSLASTATNATTFCQSAELP